MNLLSPFGKLYGRIMDLRNLLYDRGVLKSCGLGARTISVGNLTTGGTGKTPFVALVAKILIDDGETVCILTRGYGRKDPKARVLVSDGESILADAEFAGDEPVELAYKLDGKAIIVADSDRVAAAKWATSNFAVTTFILDDGFQHRRARRRYDIVCIDATNPCGNGRLLPAGSLRESFKGLKRADAIVITRTEQVEEMKSLERRIISHNAVAAIFTARTHLTGLVTLADFHAKTERPQKVVGQKLFAFTGIGNPGNFFKSLAIAHAEVVASEPFPDHHRFTQEDISLLESKAEGAGAEALVTTAKDAVKLNGINFTLPCQVALAETTIDDIDAFKKLISFS